MGQAQGSLRWSTQINLKELVKSSSSVQRCLSWVLGWNDIYSQKSCGTLLCTSLSLSLKVTQLRPTLCDPTGCSLPGSSVYGILQARILEWIVIPFSRGSFQSRNRAQVSCVAGRFFTVWATGKTNQGSNPTSLHWKHRVLNTRLSGKSWHWSSLTEDIL